MQDSVGSLSRHAAIAACLALLFVSRASAQPLPTTPAATSSAPPEFLSRYDFHISTAGLATDDPMFSWEAHFGGDFDLVERCTVCQDAAEDFLNLGFSAS